MPKTSNPPPKAQTSSESLLMGLEIMALDGYATFPTQNKRPIIAGESWKNAQIDNFPVEQSYPFSEYGVVLRPDDLIVDIDPRNFPDERKIWSEFCAAHNIPSLSQSRIVQTGSGGMHIYLKKPANFQVRKNLKEYPGLDFLSAGSYVIGVGSKVQGKSYKFIVNKKPLAAPSELLNALVKSVPEFTEKYETHYRDTEENIKGFIEYLMIAPVSVQGQAGDINTFKIACRGRDFNLSPDQCLEIISKHFNPRCRPPWTEPDLRRKVLNAYNYNQAPAGTRDPVAVLPEIDKKTDVKDWMIALDVTGVGAYRNSLKNAVLFISHDKNLGGKFAFNLFSCKIELSGQVPWEKKRINYYREINDLEVGHVALYLAQVYNVEFPIMKIWEALAICAGEYTRNPIKEWLSALVWDGKKRLDKWLTTYCGAADSAYARGIGSKTLVAAVARIYEPGIKFDTVLILEGEQGVGKSTTCAILGGKWFGDAPIDVNNMKDTIEYVHSHWIIEFSEMAGARKADVNKLKNFLSSCEDDARPAYARSRIRFPRQSIFIGTVNPDSIGYLSDDTGNRRFWPIFCHKFDTERLREDRDNLFAEARLRYEKGESLYLALDLAKTANHEAMDRLVKDPWLEIIGKFIKANPGMDETTTSDIFIKVLGGNNMNLHTGHSRRIATALKHFGFRLSQGTGANLYRREILLGAKTPEHPEGTKNPFELTED